MSKKPSDLAEVAETERMKAEVSAKEAKEAARKEQQQRQLVEKKSKELEVALTDVRKQKDIAEQKTKEVEKKSKELEVALADVRKQKDIADKQTEIAVAEKKAADVERQKADIERQKAVAAKEAEEYEAYIARIGLAAAKIEENAFDVAIELLEQCPESHRNWEWGRLRHLCSFAQQAMQAEGPVDAVEISPDGKLLLTGSWDHKARIWDIARQAVVQELPQQGLYVHSVAWSPDQKYVATAGSDVDGRIRLWTAQTGELVAKFNGHTDAVVSVKFSPNGKWLLTCSYDETARLWNIENPRQPIEVQVLSGHSWWVWDGDFSPDFDPSQPGNKNRIVTVSQDGKAIIWKLKTATNDLPVRTVTFQQEEQTARSTKLELIQEAIFTGHEGPIYSVAYSPAGDLVATASYDKRVLMWNPDEVPAFNLDNLLQEQAASVQQRELLGHSSPVQSVRFSHDGHLLISGGRDNAVKIWDVATAKSIKTFRGHHSEVRSVDISPNGRQVISGAKDKNIVIWNVDQYEEFRVLNGKELVGHEDAILGAKFSDNGQYILTAGRDRTARLWNSKTGESIRTFEEGHDFLTSKGLFLPGGRTLVTSAADNSVRLWNVESGTQLLRIPETGRGALIAISPDGKWLATGYEPAIEIDQSSVAIQQQQKQWSVLVWKTEDLLQAAQEEVSSFQLRDRLKPIVLNGHFNRVTALAFSPNENRLLSCDFQGRSILWDLKTELPIWSQRHHQRSITDCAFSPDGNSAFVSSADRTISRLNVTDGTEQTDSIFKHPSGVNSLKISPDGKNLVSVCLLESDLLNPGSLLTVWDLSTGQKIKQIESPQFALNDIHFTPSGDSLIAVCNDNAVRVVDLRAEASSKSLGEPILDFAKFGGLVWSASFTEDGHSILTVGGSEAHIWDWVTRRKEMTFSPHGAVAAADFSSDGEFIVTGSWDNSAKIWNIKTGQAVKKLIGGHNGYINSAEFSPDNRFVLTGSDDMTAKLWDILTGQVVQTYAGHQGRVRQATFSPDGSLILTVSNDRTARIWNTKTGEQIGQPYEKHDWAVLCGAFSPDGKRFMTGGEDNQALLWEVGSHKEPIMFEGHTAAVTSVAFSHDGARVFTASQDNSAKIWDATPGREDAEILTLTEQEQELTSIAVSPDGTQVVTGSRDGTAVIWLTASWETPIQVQDKPLEMVTTE